MTLETALDLPGDVLDAEEAEFVDSIRKHGWFRTQVSGDEEGPGFSFTTGFWASTGQPEILVFNLKSEIVHQTFWSLFDAAKAGHAVPVGKRSDAAFATLPCYFFPVAERWYRDYLGWSNWFYRGQGFPCLQLVWPDRSGRFPWEADFDPDFVGDQPDLTDQGWMAAVDG